YAEEAGEQPDPRGRSDDLETPADGRPPAGTRPGHSPAWRPPGGRRAPGSALMLAGRPAPAAQHGRGGDEHEPGEQAEQQVGRDAGGQAGARVGAGHAEDAEGDAWREADPA